MTISIDATSSYTASTSTTTTSSSEQILDKEDFLTLLVAQMENQDPLDPADATEYTSQLAQYSSLEQLMNLNTNVESMMTMLSSNQSSSLDTLGKDVASYGDSFIYDGESIELGYELESSAESVTLLIQQNGTTISEVAGSELDVGSHYVSWSGLTDDGSQVSSGEYTVVVEATDDSGNEVDSSSIICSQVTGVDQNGEGGGTLITDNGELSYSDVLAVFN